MEIYLAPLQGLTDWIFRESFSEHIGQFDKTFTPFVRVQNDEFFRPSQCNDLIPAHNVFQNPVPQFLGNDFESFKKFEDLCLQNDYKEVNINMGCPFPIVVKKGMGAGILPNSAQIAQLMEAIFSTTKLNISIKCRLGLDNTAEFEHLIPIFNSYPLSEVIIHARLGKQQYKGEVNMEAFGKYAALLKHPICYNGDILSLKDVEQIETLTPNVSRIMIGRGILQNPFLLAEIKRQELTRDAKVKMLRDFHISIIERCKEKYAGNLNLLRRLEEMWSYHYEGFEDGKKIFKQIKKANTLEKYEGVIFKAINEM